VGFLTVYAFTGLIVQIVAGCSSTLNLTVWEREYSSDIRADVKDALISCGYTEIGSENNSDLYQHNKFGEQFYCISSSDDVTKITAVLFKPALFQSGPAKQAFDKIEKIGLKNGAKINSTVIHKEYIEGVCP